MASKKPRNKHDISADERRVGAEIGRNAEKMMDAIRSAQAIMGHHAASAIEREALLFTEYATKVANAFEEFLVYRRELEALMSTPLPDDI